MRFSLNLLWRRPTIPRDGSASRSAHSPLTWYRALSNIWFFLARWFSNYCADHQPSLGRLSRGTQTPWVTLPDTESKVILTLSINFLCRRRQPFSFRSLRRESTSTDWFVLSYILPFDMPTRWLPIALVITSLTRSLYVDSSGSTFSVRLDRAADNTPTQRSTLRQGTRKYWYNLHKTMYRLIKVKTKNKKLARLDSFSSIQKIYSLIFPREVL